MKRALGIAAVGAGILAIGGYLYRAGYFSTSTAVVQGGVPPMKIMYVKHRGSYKELEGIYADLRNKAKQLGLKENQTMTIGIFYDNPSKTQPAEQRAVIGLAVDSVDESLLTRYVSSSVIEMVKPADRQLEERLVKERQDCEAALQAAEADYSTLNQQYEEAKKTEKLNAEGIMDDSKLEIELLEGRNIYEKDEKDPDVYCQFGFEVAQAEPKVSDTIQNNQNPKWTNAKWTLPVTKREDVLKIIVTDSDMLVDDCLGTVRIPLSELQDQTLHDKWYQIMDKNGMPLQSKDKKGDVVGNAQLHVKLQYTWSIAAQKMAAVESAKRYLAQCDLNLKDKQAALERAQQSAPEAQAPPSKYSLATLPVCPKAGQVQIKTSTTLSLSEALGTYHPAVEQWMNSNKHKADCWIELFQPQQGLYTVSMPIGGAQAYQLFA